MSRSYNKQWRSQVENYEKGISPRVVPLNRWNWEVEEELAGVRTPHIWQEPTRHEPVKSTLGAASLANKTLINLNSPTESLRKRSLTMTL